MSTTPVSFSALTTAITQLGNDVTSSNTAIGAELLELKQLLVDFSGAIAGGGAVSQSDLAAAIAQVEGIDATLTASTATVTSATAAIAQADPASNPAPPTPAPAPAA
jgi:hypothetical protein